MHLGGIRVHVARAHRDTGTAQQLLGVPALLGQHDGHDVTVAAGPGGPTRPVQIGLVFHGRIDVYDQFDIVDVDTTSCDVGRDQHPGGTAAERGQVAFTSRLGQIAVQIDRRHTGIGELLGQFAGLMLGAHEQDPAAGPGGQSVHQFLLLGNSPDVEHMVGHLRRGIGDLVDRVQHRIVEEPPDQLVDAVVQRRREQQPLPVGRGGRHDPGDTGKEAEIGHVVGFVEDGDGHVSEADHLLPHQIFQTSGAGHHDVDTRAQRTDLLALRHATEDGGDTQAARGGQRLQGCGDLGRQLAGRRQHQSGRARGLTAASGQRGHQRDRERQRFPAAGLSAAEDIASCQRVRKSGGLDGERLGDTTLGQGLHQGCGHAEMCEGRGVHVRLSGCRACARRPRRSSSSGSAHTAAVSPSSMVGREWLVVTGWSWSFGVIGRRRLHVASCARGHMRFGAHGLPVPRWAPHTAVAADVRRLRYRTFVRVAHS